MVAEAGEIKEVGLISDANLESFAFNFDYHSVLYVLRGMGGGGELQERRHLENFHKQ